MPPTLSLPPDTVLEATSSAGAVHHFTVTATDDMDPSPVVECDPPSGSTVPLGTTWVTCTPLLPTSTPVPPTDTPTPVPPTDTPTLTATPEMVYVPADLFTMGSPQGEGEHNEHPQRRIYLDAFWIDRTEVTNAQYRKCVEAKACHPPKPTDYHDDHAYDDHPVCYVSWFQAKDYCEWKGKRLPTEAEWEKAARGTDERTYPWGDRIDCDRAQYKKCGGQTVLVGSKPKGKSPYEALDMAGNVWEWVEDWLGEDYYGQSPPQNPPGPDSGGQRVQRGGSWNVEAYSVRSAYRGWGDPDYGSGEVGFRCAKGSQ